MQLTLVILAALAPVVAILWYIYRKDKLQPEPPIWLMKAFGFGVISAFLGLCLSIAICSSLGIEIGESVCTNIPEAFANAFLSAAIPEEAAKLLMLWLLLRKNPHYDELFDGIVYAVFIGMGFAGLENIEYLLGGISDGSWVGIGIGRALLAVPGHALFAVLMGYYYSLYHFGIDRSTKTMIMIPAAPILAHGIWDGIIFSLQVNEVVSVAGIIIFFIFFYKLKKKGKEKIERLMNQ